MQLRFNGQGPRTWIATVAVLVHLSIAVGSGALRWEHVLADGLLLGFSWAAPRARDFAWGAFPFWLAGMLIDNQRFWIHLRAGIHTGDLWDLEAKLFPATLAGAETTWAAYFTANTHWVADAICGFAYLTYIAVVLVVLIVLFFSKSPRFERLGASFLLANVLGMIIYLAYPAAPPWYVMAHGPGPAILDAPASAAGAARFDELFGISYFASFYGRNPNIFGAMPSLHVAYPFLAIWHTWSRGWRWRAGTSLFTALVGFSAVYLAHHYILDVLAGFAVAAVAAGAVDLFAVAIGARDRYGVAGARPATSGGANA